MVLGRSAAALETYSQHLQGKTEVRVVCMDLASGYRALVRQYFPQARIVADRFYVIRLINQHFLACWREIDPAGSKNRGLLRLMRRHRHNLSPAQQEKLATYLLAHPAQTARKGIMWLIAWDWGLAPVVGVEPTDDARSDMGCSSNSHNSAAPGVGFESVFLVRFST